MYCRFICISSRISSDMNSSLFMDMELSYNYQFPCNHDSGSSNAKQTTPILMHDEIFNPTWESIFLQQNNNPSQISRKRSAEAFDDHTKHITNQSFSLSATNEDKQACFRKHVPKCKKQKDSTSTVRRSQKLTDKITALQKLVSPYGKSDTASVLLEASISIKALQDHIKNSIDVLVRESSKHNMEKRKRYDLQSVDLCLVPLKISEEIVREVSPNIHSSVFMTN